MTKLERLENLLLSLWVGTMAGVGYISTPVLFKFIDDRQLAGSLAGEMFYIVISVGLALGGVLFILRYKVEGVELFKQWRGGLLVLMLGLLFISMFVLQPMMADVKALGMAEGSEQAKKFGMLHGLSSLAYMATIISGCILILFSLRKPENLK